MEKIAAATFTTELVRDGSWGTQDLGSHESTMTLYKGDRPGSAFIEWDIPALDEVEQIGLAFDVLGNLLDYDGVFSLPHEAIELIRSAGFKVSKEFE